MLLRLRGARADLEAALDWLYVRTSVLGVVASEGQIEIAIEGVVDDTAAPPFELPPELGRRIAVERLAAAEGPLPTGLENDVALRIGERILVRPPWVSAPVDFRGVELVVPRAMAFGSGEHGSTQAALCLMEQLFTDAIASLADVGTGSGILALYARARGCPDIYACDVDPVAVAAAEVLLPGAIVVCGGPAALSTPVDAVVSNMRSGELRDCMQDLLELWTGNGPLMLSGLRRDEVEDFASQMALLPTLGRQPDRRVDACGFAAIGWWNDHARYTSHRTLRPRTI